MRLYFATGNPHKIAEVNGMVPVGWEVLPISDLGFSGELPEHQDTLEGNAIEKVNYLVEQYGVDGFSEDTGLEVTALGGAPGPFAARYAGAEKSDRANMAKLLRALDGQADRSAQFRTVIALHLNGNMHLFEGIVKGRIAHAQSGTGGFGYDPLFVPEGYTDTFAALPPAVKAQMSHRYRALQKMIAFLEKGTTTDSERK